MKRALSVTYLISLIISDVKVFLWTMAQYAARSDRFAKGALQIPGIILVMSIRPPAASRVNADYCNDFTGIQLHPAQGLKGGHGVGCHHKGGLQPCVVQDASRLIQHSGDIAGIAPMSAPAVPETFRTAMVNSPDTCSYSTRKFSTGLLVLLPARKTSTGDPVLWV